MTSAERLKREYPNIPPYEIDAIARSIMMGAANLGTDAVDDMIYHDTPRLLQLRGYNLDAKRS